MESKGNGRTNATDYKYPNLGNNKAIGAQNVDALIRNNAAKGLYYDD
jgi:hypothetical protein